MKKAPPPHIAKYKIEGEPGRIDGAYRILCTMSGRVLQVIASDGSGWAESGLPGSPWEHVSVCLAAGTPGLPTWQEMHWLKRLFWEDTELAVQFHPPQADYVNRHVGVLHLWRNTGIDYGLPPTECV